MDWATPIDLYCERVGPAYWAEPINALSNVSFVLAALWGWVEARRRTPQPIVIKLLLSMAALIGIGSFLFHTHANVWSELTDTIPIWSFVATYVLVSVNLIGGVRPGRLAVIAAIVAAIIVVVFLASSDPAATAVPTPSQPLLNGSLQYAPALIALVVFTAVTLRRQHPIAPWVLGATLAFTISLVFRTIDLAVCPGLPIGTHFLWHLMNGAMVALLLQALIRTPRPVIQ